MIRGLSLTQPWASLVAIGAKRWETRSWETAFRCRVAIQAAKKYPASCRELEYEEPFLSALKRGLGDRAHALPTGQIIALATLTDCRRTEEFFAPGSRGPASRRGVIVGAEEWAFGDYTEGRFAFRFDNVVPLRTPIECKGALGFWTVPDSVLTQIDEEVGAMGPDEVSHG